METIFMNMKNSKTNEPHKYTTTVQKQQTQNSSSNVE